MTNIVIISGSPREVSVSLRIAKHLLTVLDKNEDLQIELFDLSEIEIPEIQKVWKKEEDVPENYLPIFEKMKKADGFILVSPEYNGSYSPAMKNLLDHFPKSIYKQKPFGIVTGSLGAMGGMRAAQQLLLLVPALFGIASPMMMIVPQMDKKFDEKGNLLEESFSKSIDNFLDEYLWLLNRLKERESQLT